LTTLFGSTVVTPIAVPKKKRTLMPLLTVVFLASYGLMTMLIVEQGTTIQAQRNLIQVLLVDSKELWAMRGKASQARAAQGQAQGSQTQAPMTQVPMSQGQSPSVQAPSIQIPSTQAPSTSTPSTQAAPQQRSQSSAGKTAKPKGRVPQTQVPPKPASDLTDQRRALITI
jgi:predicted lipid-binding transport protein (Tim44 family)